MMKKTITPKGLWMLFMLVFLNTTLQAQTEQETLKFLETYYSSIPAQGTWPNHKVEYTNDEIYVDMCISQETESRKCTVYDTEYFYPSHVVGIEISHIPYEQIGKSTIHEAWLLKIFSDGKKGAYQNVRIYIDPSKDRAYVERFKKALLKLASLKGAKIVDESLFDK